MTATPTLPGVDVSYAQGSIDWHAVATDAVFASIKATEGRDFIDPTFSRERVAAAENALGKLVAYYHFARADTPSTDDAREECRDFVNAVKSRGGRLSRNGVLDYERAAAGNGDDEAWIAAWVNEYRKLTGARPWIYGGSVLRDQGVSSTFGCPLWLAAYTSSPDPYIPTPWKKEKGPRFRVWQFTDKGTCKGVRGPVDRNRFYGSRADLVNFMAR